MNIARTEVKEAKPIVSIVIPCYNAENSIGESIESALCQQYDNAEIIVIDDGSTDNSLKIIRSFGNNIIWRSGNNSGGCAARNRGIGIASGEFIQFLDADDVLYPNKLLKQVELSQRFSRDIIYTDHILRGTELDDLPIYRGSFIDELDPFVLVLRHRTLHTIGPLYRKDWIRRVGGFLVGLPASQEFELNLRISILLIQNGGRFRRLAEPLFEVRRREGSVSSDTAKTFSNKATYLPVIADKLRELGELTEYRRTELAVYAANMGRQCIRGGEIEAGLTLVQFASSLDSDAVERRAWGPMARYCKRIIGPVGVEWLGSIKRTIRGARKRIS